MSLKLAWNPKIYQKRAIQLLLSQASAGLFLDPGLGKTSTVLATIKILKEKNLIKKVLIVAPLRPMLKTWPDEIKKWEDFNSLTYTILHGTGKTAALGETTDIHLINPEGIPWLFDPATARPEYDVLVVDESTVFKNSQTKRFKCLKPWLPCFKRRWILTGTPAPNGLMDLFGQIYILDLGRSLGRFVTHFRQEFFQQSGYSVYEWSPKPGSMKRVVERISPLILQLSAEDYLEMPELVSKGPDGKFLGKYVELPPKAREIYDEVEKEFISRQLDYDIVAANSAVAGVKCRQVANGAIYGDGRCIHEIHDQKLEALDDLMAELGEHPKIILYEFDHDKTRILERYPGIPVLGAGLTEKELDTLIDRFNAGSIPNLLGHPASMGYGLNLQGACHHVIWFGIPWNLWHYDQAIARVYRQGQTNSHVYVHHIVAKDTKDEDVIKVLIKKDKTQGELLSAIGRHRQENYEELSE